MNREETKPIRFIAYGRVSTIEQKRHGISIDAQRERIEAYVKFQGGDLVEWYEDAASGRTLARPNLKRALASVLSGEADSFAVYSIDRLGRSTIGVLGTIRELSAAGVGFVSVREQLDSTTPHGRFTVGILALVAELESDLISSRVSEVHAFRRRQGKLVTTPPYGFRRRADGSKELEPIQEEVEVITRIVSLYHIGYKVDDIRSRLDRERIKPRRARSWSWRQVKNIIDRAPFYFPEMFDGPLTKKLCETPSHLD